MKYLITTAILAASVALAAPSFAQDSAPGTSVQTGAAASNSANGGSMNNGSMAADSTMHHPMKKKSHTTAMNTSPDANTDANNGVVNKNSDMPGNKTTGNAGQ